MKVQFRSTPWLKTYEASDVHIENDGQIVDLPPHRAKALLKAFPQNFFPPGKFPPQTPVLQIRRDARMQSTIQREGEYDPQKYNLGIFMDGVANYVSGGRYHTWLFANALADIFNTTIITSFDPRVYSQSLCNPKLKVLVDPNYALGWRKNPFNILLGAPVHGGIAAYKYGKKWGIPFYLMMLEPPNFTKKYRSGADTTEEYWATYKKCLAEAKRTIFSCKTTAEYGKKWGLNPGKIAVIYAPLNQQACQQAPDQKEANEIVWISRNIGFKRPGDALAIAQRYGLKINFITSRASNLQTLAQQKGIQANVHIRINDVEKFKIIKRCKFMVHPSLFEGFGMPPGEALLCKRPCIVYDYPTFREIYTDKLEYARYKDQKYLLQIAGKLLGNPNYRRKRGEEGYSFIKPQSSFERTRQSFLKIMPAVKKK